MFVPPFHAEGSKIIDSTGKTVVGLRGLDFIELAYGIDVLREGGTLDDRANRFRSLGVNYVRIEINYNNWNANLDTNGDGVGNRDFTIMAVDALARKGIFSIVELHTAIPNIFYTSPTAWANWIVENLVTPFIDRPYVISIGIMNEPRYNLFGSTNIGGGITREYWNAVKTVCASIHAANPNLLMIAHADMNNGQGFPPLLATEPIPTPNVQYSWHFYYPYCPAFNPYHPWGSLNPDPTYEDCKQRGNPYYQTYAEGNYETARQELEQITYNRFLWVAAELDLPIIMDEFGFNGDEIPHFSRRKCPNGDWEGVVNETLDENGNLKTPPFTGTVYCPIDGVAIPQPAPHGEPGWPQCFKDYLSILNKYDVPWTYFGWWPKVYGGYGLIEHDMKTLSKTGMIWKNYLSPTTTKMSLWVLAAIALLNARKK